MTFVARVVCATLTIAAITLGADLNAGMPMSVFRPAPAEAMHAELEGFGAVTRGGAGQPECVVTALADSGPGTLRDCLSHGNRYIRFEVAGDIVLRSRLYVMGGFVTIDGFSAPAPGITLRGHSLLLWRQHSTYLNDAHDVIVRGIRVRDAALAQGAADCIGIYGAVYNVVIDHVSVANCGDGGIDVTGGARNITIQWSIVTDDKAFLLGATGGGPLAQRISLHHNLVANGVDRMPLVRPSGNVATDTIADIRQNIFEGWLRANGTRVEGGGWANVVGNTYIPRPDTTIDQREDSVRFDPSARVFTAGNVELGAPPSPNYNTYGNERSPLPAPPITAMPGGCVVAYAGVHPRDAVDNALLARVTRVPAGCDDSPVPPPATPILRPDLVSRALSAPATGIAGQTLSLSATIANVGTAVAPASTARLYLSTDRTVSTGDAALGTLAVPSLTPGATHTGTTTITLPAASGAGAYMLLVRADDGSAITESSEANNTLAIPMTIATSSGSGPFTPVLMEAESMAVTSGMSVGSDSRALGGRYISPTSGANSTAPVREASLTVTVPTAGTYYLWARMYAPSTASDALYFGIDATWDRVYPSATGTYQWVQIESTNGSGALGFQLAAGPRTIQVGRGEVNTRLDALYLTNSATDVPKFAPGSATFVPSLVEAESMAVTSGMSVGSDSRALGGRYISPTSGANSTAPVREASLTVTVPTAGTYYLWARMYAPSTASDALYFGIDATWDRVYPSATGTYEWVRIESTGGSGTFGFQLAPGSHTIQVGRGEVNTRLDAVYLTNNATIVPTFAP